MRLPDDPPTTSASAGLPPERTIYARSVGGPPMSAAMAQEHAETMVTTATEAKAAMATDSAGHSPGASAPAAKRSSGLRCSFCSG